MYMFLFDRKPVPYCESYKYLGCSINEFLESEFTVNQLADSAGRALGSIITKMIKIRGFPFSVFTTLVCAPLLIMEERSMDMTQLIQQSKYILELPVYS
jgi:hypothetical protein